jgi:predicted AAA+ superfamily ATPase
MQRIYQKVIQNHLENFRQMLFLVGPRQVGKTTLSLSAKDMGRDFFYFNFDILEDRQIITAGAKHIWESIKGDFLREQKPIIVFDEIHKYSKWKNLLKGFFDSYHDKIKIIVTGGARLDVYKAGGDSLMGRYLSYIVCPLSVGELTLRDNISQELNHPIEIPEISFHNLWAYGGFPELFIKANKRLTHRMQKLRSKQLFYEDMRSLSNIHEISQLEVMAELLKFQVGGLINRTELAKKINVAVSTISRWLSSLEAFYYCFQVKPWSKNISRSLVKEPKIYLWDWSLIAENGPKSENFIACHLLKAVLFWNDQGHGDYDLYYLRDKDKREVDFLVVKDNLPWFLVEVKYSNNQGINKNLYYYQEQTKARHAFQVIIDASYVNIDCFKTNLPIIVPAKTLLSQLV